MQIKISSVMVRDQQQALKFHTEKLGFQKMADIPFGDYRWLTVTSPDGIAGVELSLEPMAFAPAKVFQQALYEAGIPATAFLTQDIQAEMKELQSRGVVFRGEPTNMGPITAVMFDDSCGNWIHLVQPNQ